MTVRRIDTADVELFPYSVPVPWPRPRYFKEIPWHFGKVKSHRRQYDDHVMEYWSFEAGPIGYWIAGDEATGAFMLDFDMGLCNLVFRFTDADTAFLFKMRFV
ncbi:MAG: hypothetical protein EOP83_25640 [Verrucomicrobiaceae bacterium]|nr:MAG: hypothetical protein EOP83_25640 [Verrucomicrobiaceae bacterium]